MEIVSPVAPDPRLAPFVRCLGHRRTLQGSSAITQPHIASLGPVLSFELGDRVAITRVGEQPYFHRPVHVMGTQTRYLGHYCLTAQVLEFGIFFQPFGFWQLFGIPPVELTDRDGDATALMGSWLAELWHKMAEAETDSERVGLVTETLLGFLKTARRLTPIMSTVQRLLPSDEAAKIHRAARESAMSIRSYERGFAAEMGFSPKTFARLARFEQAVDIRRAGRDSWLNVSHQMGYFDQMHMIRDFRIFGGRTPGRLLLPDSDFQPWSIQAPLSVPPT